MKKIVVFILLLLAACNINAQQQNTPAEKLAHHIANKMADSLNLTNQQRQNIFTANMDLHQQKMQARSKSQDRIIVGKELQRIEGTRNSYYKNILTETEYNLYFQKRQVFITAN